MADQIADSSQFYIPESRQALIQRAHKGLLNSKIVALQGESGIGKTTIIEEILTQSFPDANKCYITIAEGLSDIQIRSRIIEQLFGHVLFDPELPLVTSFMEFNQPNQMMIAIDNAHYLSGRLIGELLQLVSESRNLGIELVLITSFDRSISSTLLNVSSGLIDIVNIGKLSKAESYHFLVEYFDDVPAQTNTEVKRWIDSANGLPKQLLAFRSNTESPVDSKPLNLALWISIVVCGSLALALGVYLYRLNLLQQGVNLTPTELVTDWQQEPVEKEPASASKENIYSQLTAEPVNDTSSMILQELTSSVSASDAVNQQLPLKTEQEVTKDSGEVEVSKATDVKDEDSVKDLEPAKQDELKKLNEALIAELEQEAKELEIKENKPKSEKAPSELSLTAKDEKQDDISLDFFDTTSPNEPTEQNGSAAQTKPDEEYVVDGVVSNENEGQPIPVSDLRYRIDNQQFLALPNDKFVLQVTAVSTEEVLAEYLSSSVLPVEDLNIYKITRSGKDWIVVTYGLFDTIESARAKAAEVAPKAWAKSTSVVQQQILAYQKSLEEQ